MMVDILFYVLTGLAVLGALGVLLWARSANQLLSTRLDQLAADSDGLRNEVRALVSSAVGTGRKLAALESELRARPAVPVEPSVPEAPAAEKPYQMAAKLMQHGADIEELMSVCGLTRGEAELLASLHQRPRRNALENH